MNSQFYEKNGLSYKGRSYDLLVDDTTSVIHVRLSGADFDLGYGLIKSVYAELKNSFFARLSPSDSRVFLYTEGVIFEWRASSYQSLSPSDYGLIYNGYVK